MDVWLDHKTLCFWPKTGTEATSRATTAEKDGDKVRTILKKMEEDMNSANITIQQLQARVAESAEAVQEVKLNLVVSEAETHKLTKQLETARARINPGRGQVLKDWHFQRQRQQLQR